MTLFLMWDFLSSLSCYILLSILWHCFFWFIVVISCLIICPSTPFFFPLHGFPVISKKTCSQFPENMYFLATQKVTNLWVMGSTPGPFVWSIIQNSMGLLLTSICQANFLNISICQSNFHLCENPMIQGSVLFYLQFSHIKSLTLDHHVVEVLVHPAATVVNPD